MPAIRRRWTSADVRTLIDESRAWPRYELVGGELLVTPAPGWGHQLTVLELAFILEQYALREPVGVVVISPADIELRPNTIVQPDVFVVPVGAEPFTGIPRTNDVNRLLLAIEVVSPSTVRTDRVEKRDFYMDAGVGDYWIVDPDARIIERWTPAGETPVILRDRLEWHPAGAESALVVDLPALFDRVATKLRLIGR